MHGSATHGRGAQPCPPATPISPAAACSPPPAPRRSRSPPRARSRRAPRASRCRATPRRSPRCRGEQMRWAIVGLGSFGDQPGHPRLRRRAPVAHDRVRLGQPRQGARPRRAARGQPVLRLRQLRHDEGQRRDRLRLHRAPGRPPRRVHGPRARGRQARAVREADGLDQRRVRADDRRRQGQQPPARRRLPRPFRADQPRGQAPHRRGRARRDPRGPERPRVQRQPRVPAAQVAAREGARRRRLDVRHRRLRPQHLADDARGRHARSRSRRSTPTRATTRASPRSKAGSTGA